jgi:peptidoglycan-associated lipoprotein
LRIVSSGTKPNIGTSNVKKDNTSNEKEFVNNYNPTTHIGNIYYDFKKWRIVDTAKTILNSIIKALKADTCLEIQMRSFTDTRGTDKYNIKLSKKRANSAAKYLVANGIEVTRIKCNGLGKAPVNDGESGETSYLIERRTEFEIRKKENCK